MQKEYLNGRMKEMWLLRILLVIALLLPYINCYKLGKYYNFQSLSQSGKPAITKNAGLLNPIQNYVNKQKLTQTDLNNFEKNNKDNNKQNKSASTARNENYNDYILASALSPKDKKISDIDTEIVYLKAKIITLEVDREEVKVAIKQFESDMSKCTSKTDQQELSAKLSTKETYLNIFNSLTQEIVAKETRINFLASQMNGINLPSSSDDGK